MGDWEALVSIDSRVRPYRQSRYVGLAKITSLLVLPFAHEDLAIILGGYIIVNDLMPVSLVCLSIYGGIVASDFALYGIGAAARHVPWLSRYAVDDRVHRFSDTLKRTCLAWWPFAGGAGRGVRRLHRLRLDARFACPFHRREPDYFGAVSAVMLYLVIVFGDALDDRVGMWAWPMCSW